MAIDFDKYIPKGSVTTKKSSVDFDKYLPVKPTLQTPSATKAPVTKTVNLSSGGVFKAVEGKPNELVKTERSNYGGVPVKTGLFGLPSAERADIVPVSLGGVNSAKENITYEKYPVTERLKDFANKVVNSKLVNQLFPSLKSKVALTKTASTILPKKIETPIKQVLSKEYIPQTNTDKYLKNEILPAYKAGEITLREAQAKAVSFLQTEQAGIKQGVAANLPSAVWDTLKDAAGTVYDVTGSLVIPGITPEELRDPAFLKNVLYSVPEANKQLEKEFKKNPFGVYIETIKGTTKGVTKALTDYIVNYMPQFKGMRAETKQEVENILNKYIPTSKTFGTGYTMAGEAAPMIAAGGVGGELAGTAGNVGGFLSVGQLGLEKEASVKERATQATRDLIALGVLKVGTDAVVKVTNALTNGFALTDVKAPTIKPRIDFDKYIEKPTDVSKTETPSLFEKGEAKKQPVVIDADLLKKEAGDYDPAHHEKYSELAKRQYAQELTVNKNPVVKFTAGGTGSGKSEVILPNIKKDFDGIIVDTTFSEIKTALPKIKQALAVGKTPEIHLSLPEIRDAWRFSLYRGLTTGRKVPLEIFAEKHVGVVETIRKVQEMFPQVKIFLHDNRVSAGLGVLESKVITSPGEIKNILNSLNYSKENIVAQLKNETLPRMVLKDVGKNLDEIVNEINKGGITYDVIKKRSRGGEPYTAVSIYPERSRIFEGALKKKDILMYIKDNLDLLVQRNHTLGGWYDTKTKQLWLDVTVVVKSEARAIELGRQFNQKSVFNLERFEELQTGGTGEAIKNLPTIEERVKLTREINKSEVKQEPKEDIVAPEIKNEKPEVVEPKIEKVKTKEFESRVFERLKAERPDLEGDLTVERKNMEKDAFEAVKLIEKDKQKAYDIAMGKEVSSEVTSTAVNIALAEKALAEGNNKLYAKLITNRSLAQTRRGQELVAEKASITDNSVSRYVKELVSNRLERLGKDYLSDLKDIFKKRSPKQKATEKIDKEVSKLETRIKSKKLDVKTALSLLEKITCV